MKDLTNFNKVSTQNKKIAFNKSIQILALKPEFLEGIKTDQELYDRILQFADTLYKNDPYGDLL